MLLWGCNLLLLALAALTSLFLAGDGPACSWLALLSSLLCEKAWQCLSLWLFTGVTIPGSGLLFQVNSLRLPSGHSGPVLILSNAACTSLPSPHLLVADAGVCAASLLGVTMEHVICGFKLFIYFSSQLCCPMRFQGSPQTRQWECFLVCGNLSLFLRLPSQYGSLSLSILPLFLSFTFFPTFFWIQWAAFLGAWCPLPAFRSCFVEFTRRLNVLLMNLLGRKWSPRPIPLPS